VEFDADDAVGLDFFRFLADVVQTVFAGVVDEACDLVDLAFDERLEEAEKPPTKPIA